MPWGSAPARARATTLARASGAATIVPAGMDRFRAPSWGKMALPGRHAVFSERSNTMTQRILFISSQPHDLARLAAENEFRAVCAALPNSTVTYLPAVRPADLAQAFVRYRPAVIHFCVHSSATALALQDDNGDSISVDHDSILSLLEASGCKPRLLFFNAALSASLAAKAVMHSEAAIGIDGMVGTNAAIAFAASFYGSLGRGTGLAASFSDAATIANIGDASDSPYRLFQSETTSKDPVIDLVSEGSKQRQGPLPQEVLPWTVITSSVGFMAAFGASYMSGLSPLVSIVIFAVSLIILTTGFFSYLRGAPFLPSEISLSRGTIKFREHHTLPHASSRVASPDVSISIRSKQLLGRNDPETETTETETTETETTETETEATETEALKAEVVSDVLATIGDTVGAITTQKIRDCLPEELLDATEGRIKKYYTTRLIASDIDKVASRGRQRLLTLVDSLDRKATVNLIIGIAIALSGLGGLSLLQSSTNRNLWELNEISYAFMSTYLPRLGLIAIVELLALFFLKLYRGGLSDIKYYQNELTNLECRFAALRVSISTGGEASVDVAIQGLIATERNFILDKGKTTVELEKLRHERDETSQMVKVMSEVLLNKSRM